MGSGGGRGGRTALPKTYSDVLFVDRTSDGDNTMEIDGEEMAEEEADAVAEEE